MKRENRTTTRARRERGTVILLVIAALALLAIIGTAYIVSARVDRNTARNTSESHNLELAVQATIQQARTQILESTLRRVDGRVMAVGVKPWMYYRARLGVGLSANYAFGDLCVATDGNIYFCTTPHTPSMNAADKLSGSTQPVVGPPPAAGYWVLLASWAPGYVYQLNDYVMSIDAAGAIEVYKCQAAHTSSLTPPNAPTTTAGQPLWAVAVAEPTPAPGKVKPTHFLTNYNTRDYDYPEAGTFVPLSTTATINILPTAHRQSAVPDQRWLTTDYPWWNPTGSYQQGAIVMFKGAAYMNLGASNGKPDVSPGDWRLLPYNPWTILSMRRYNPSTGTYALPLTQAAAAPSDSNVPFYFAPEVSAMVPPFANSSDPSAGFETELDSFWYLLPISSPTGVRYRVAVRIVDTNGKINVNTAQVWDTTAPGAVPPEDQLGEFLTSAVLGRTRYMGGPAANEDVPFVPSIERGNSNGIVGRRLGATEGDPLVGFKAWQGRVLAEERNGLNALAGTPADAMWFDIADELELRAYHYLGGKHKGVPYMLRPRGNESTAMLYRTLQEGDAANPSGTTAVHGRRSHTTVSRDRNWGLPQVGAAAAGGAPLAEGYNKRWTFLSTYSTPADFRLIPGKASTTTPADVVRNAAYLANAMWHAGFTQDECMSLAVNYMGQIGPASSTTLINPTGACISSNEFDVPAQGGTAYRPLLFSGEAYAKIEPAPAKTYAAYRAQPFMNEVAVSVHKPDLNTPETMKDVAVEIMNPYEGAIDLNHWRIRVKDSGNNWHIWVPNVGAALYTATGKMPSKAWGVIAHGDATEFQGIKTSAQGPSEAAASLLNTPLPTTFDATKKFTITLERPYNADATNNPASPAKPDPTKYGYVVVDYIVITPTIPTDLPAVPTVVSTQQRANFHDAAQFSWWSCVVPVYGSNDKAPTLGIENDPTILGGPGIRLPDRFGKLGVPLPDAKILRDQQNENGNPIGGNFGEFSDYMRLSIRSANVGVGGNPNDLTLGWVTLPDQLADQVVSWNGSSAGLKSSFPLEAKFRFEYVMDPRAHRFLRLFAQVDRASDGVDQIGNGAADTLEENRLAGRVNLNTASPDVLASLAPFIRFGTLDSSSGQPYTKWKHVANILAYRDRTQVTLNLGAPNTAVTSDDFSNQLLFPGRGIRSMTELIVPMALADGMLQMTNNVQTPFTPMQNTALTPPYTYMLSDIVGHNATWSKMLASCTVRSDTFVMYGYIEALRANTNPGAPVHDNAYDWYLPYSANTAANVSDDPNSSAAKNIRVAKRRFVAVIDRSGCNYPRSAGAAFTLPRVLGVRELPQ